MAHKQKRVPNLPSAKNKKVSRHEPENLDGFNIPMGWNFSQMDTDCEQIWRCTFKRLTAFNKKLLSYEGKTFQEIEQANDHSHSWHDISELHKGLQEAIRRKGLEQEVLWQLELSPKARLFGIRQHNIFKVLWLDRDHQGYKVEKKHT